MNIYIKYIKFLENYKSNLDNDVEISNLSKAYAIKDIMIDCESYSEIRGYINSLYVRKDSVYVNDMFDNIVKAILMKMDDDRQVCEIISDIRDAINELELHLDKRWRTSKNKNSYKRSEIKIYLLSLVDGPDIDTSIFGWKEFIRKKLSHVKYEDSFTEEGVFNKYQTQLVLGKLPIRDYVFLNNIRKEDIIKMFISNLNDINNLKLEKADLVSNIDLYDKSNNLILSKGDMVEVKYKDYKKMDTLGEFFSISKGSISNKMLNEIGDDIILGRKNSKGYYLISDIFKYNDDIRDRYNHIIEKLYDVVSGTIGDKILDEIKQSYVGIMFKDNKFIKSEDINIEWSLVGQRKHENRLSITHNVLRGAKVYMYIDDPSNPHFRDYKIY